MPTAPPPPPAPGAPPPPPPPAVRGAKAGQHIPTLADVMAQRAGLRKSPSVAGAHGQTANGSIPPVPGAPSPGRGGVRMDRAAGVSDGATRKMKTLQWDKVAPNAVGNTVFNADLGGLDKDEIRQKLNARGIFERMENDFRAAQFAPKASQGQRVKLESVLPVMKRQMIEISLLKTMPEPTTLGKIRGLTRKILGYEAGMTENFLNELEALLPDAEVTGKLNVYKTQPPEELEHLEAADRFLIECLKIYSLKPRVSGMIYKAKFDDNIETLEEEAQKVLRASEALLNAPHFSALLKLILEFGNYLNASGNKGGAHGFKVTSINKLVDTKSASSMDTTLLHFVAETVAEQMPDVEGFLTELAGPADAFKADLANVRLRQAEFRTAQARLETTLAEEFGNVDALSPDDGFPTTMFPFAKAAKERLAELGDLVTLAAGKYEEALKFYGEDTKSIASTQDFFSVFKTFVTSYKKARSDIDRRAIAAEKAAKAAKLKADQAAAKAAAGASGSLVEDSLRNLIASSSIDSPRVSRRDRRKKAPLGGSGLATNGDGTETNEPNSPTSTRPGTEPGTPTGAETLRGKSALSDELGTGASPGGSYATAAQSLLAKLQGDGGFALSQDGPPKTARARARTREGRRDRRSESSSLSLMGGDIPMSPEPPLPELPASTPIELDFGFALEEEDAGGIRMVQNLVEEEKKEGEDDDDS